MDDNENKNDSKNEDTNNDENENSLKWFVMSNQLSYKLKCAITTI